MKRGICGAAVLVGVSTVLAASAQTEGRQLDVQQSYTDISGSSCRLNVSLLTTLDCLYAASQTTSFMSMASTPRFGFEVIRSNAFSAGLEAVDFFATIDGVPVANSASSVTFVDGSPRSMSGSAFLIRSRLERSAPRMLPRDAEIAQTVFDPVSPVVVMYDERMHDFVRVGAGWNGARLSHTLNGAIESFEPPVMLLDFPSLPMSFSPCGQVVSGRCPSGAANPETVASWVMRRDAVGSGCRFSLENPPTPVEGRFRVAGGSPAMPPSPVEACNPSSNQPVLNVSGLSAERFAYAWLSDLAAYSRSPASHLGSLMQGNTCSEFELQIKDGDPCFFGAAGCVINSWFGPFRMEIRRGQLTPSAENGQTRNLRLLAHEYGHVVQNWAGFFNFPNYVTSFGVRAGLEGWADAFSLTYWMARRADNRAFTSMSALASSDVVFAPQADDGTAVPHSIPRESRYFGVSYPVPDGVSARQEVSLATYVGSLAQPCVDPGSNMYACGSVLSRAVWAQGWNELPYASGKGFARRDPIFVSGSVPSAAEALAFTISPQQQIRDILARYHLFLSTQANAASAPRVAEFLRLLCLGPDGNMLPACLEGRRLPDVRVPIASVRAARFSDPVPPAGTVRSVDWVGSVDSSAPISIYPPQNSYIGQLRTERNAREHLILANEFQVVGPDAEKTVVYRDGNSDFARVRLRGSNGSASVLVTFPGLGNLPYSYTVRVASGLMKPRSANQSTWIIEVLGSNGAIVSSELVPAPLNWWRPSAYMYPSPFEMAGEFRGWDEGLTRPLTLSVPPGNHTLRVRSLSGDANLYAVLLRLNCASGRDIDRDGVDDACDPEFCAGFGGDVDRDGVCKPQDNCPDVANALQDDFDGDGYGNACDACPTSPVNKNPVDGKDDNSSTAWPDQDGDRVCDAVDVCPSVRDAQMDLDRDGLGDSCDPDLDGDGLPNASDSCLTIPAPNSTPSSPFAHGDADGDGIGDECDCASPGTCPGGICPRSIIEQCMVSMAPDFEDLQKAIWAFAQAAKAYGLVLEGFFGPRVPWDGLFGCTRLPCSPPSTETLRSAFAMIESYDSPSVSPAALVSFAYRYAGPNVAFSEAEAYVDVLVKSGGRFLVGRQ